MIGLDSQSIVDTHTIFKDRHYMCDVLHCAIVHADHISHITVDYMSQSLYHDDLCCGIHNSAVFLDGMERFLHTHAAWRQERGLTIREDISVHTRWKKHYASSLTSAQQVDNASCGVYACWHATSRVLHIHPLCFTDQHVPLMRLHIYHCITADTFFTPIISIIKQRHPSAYVWHEHMVCSTQERLNCTTRQETHQGHVRSLDYKIF